MAIRKTLRFGLASLLHHFDTVIHYHGVMANDNAVRDNTSVVPSPLSLSPVFQNKIILNLKQYVKVIILEMQQMMSRNNVVSCD